MSLPQHVHDDLCRLLWAFQDGCLSEADAAHLKTLLLSNVEAREMFVRYSFLCGSLEWDYNACRDEVGSLDDVNGVVTGPLPQADGSFFELPPDWDIGPKVVPAGPLDADDTLPPVIVVGPSASSRHSGGFAAAQGYFSQVGPFSYLVSTVLMCVAVFAAWEYKLVDSQQVASGDHPFVGRFDEPAAEVARVSDMSECRWGPSPLDSAEGRPSYDNDPPNCLSFATSVAMGRKIDLEAGLLEITFQSGASVVLQGPASFEVGANGGFLSLGRLTGRLGARAKTPDSRVVRQPMPAFSIRTPSAIVTDLGTEFGVEVDKDQQTFSYVFHGSVKLHPVAAAGGNEDMVLKRHEGARVALALGKSRLVERVAIEPGRFARRVRPTAMPIAVAGTGVNVEAKQPGATWLPDQNWEVVASTGDPAFQAGPARVLDVPKLDWPINLPGRAKWISPCGAWYLFKPSGLTYTFRTTFEIDDGLSETAVLRGAYFVDKEVRAIHLNGVELPLAEVVVEPVGADRPRFDWEKVAEPFRLKIERGFVEGTNTLEFTIQNSDAVGNRDTPLSSFGFCLDLKGSVQLQP